MVTTNNVKTRGMGAAPNSVAYIVGRVPTRDPNKIG